MARPETTQTLPLALTEDGTIQITRSRVGSVPIARRFKLDATAEPTTQKFPSLPLANVYAVITNHLNHREVVEEYVHQQETEADAIQQRLEADPDYQAGIAEWHERLLASWSAVCDGHVRNRGYLCLNK